MTTEESCAVNEYLSGDDDLPVCVDLDSDNWNDNFLAELGQDEQDSRDNEAQDEDSEEMDDEPPPLNIQTYKQAVQSLDRGKT